MHLATCRSLNIPTDSADEAQIETFRTEMNRRFDEAGVEANRRLDMIGHDIADLREPITRVEESGRAGAEARDHSVA